MPFSVSKKEGINSGKEGLWDYKPFEVLATFSMTLFMVLASDKFNYIKVDLEDWEPGNKPNCTVCVTVFDAMFWNSKGQHSDKCSAVSLHPLTDMHAIHLGFLHPRIHCRAWSLWRVGSGLRYMICVTLFCTLCESENAWTWENCTWNEKHVQCSHAEGLRPGATAQLATQSLFLHCPAALETGYWQDRSTAPARALQTHCKAQQGSDYHNFFLNKAKVALVESHLHNFWITKTTFVMALLLLLYHFFGRKIWIQNLWSSTTSLFQH